MQKSERVMNKIFGAYLKELRETAGLTLLEVQDKTGISASYLNRIERNLRRAVSLPLLENMAKCYNVAPLELIGVALKNDYGDVDETPSLSAIIYSHSFSLNGMEASNDSKKEIVNMLKTVSDFEWNSESRLKDTLKLAECVDKLKKVMQ